MSLNDECALSILESELGSDAVKHRDKLDELKRHFAISHSELDCWLYAFLENKSFDVPETIAKLQRRAVMEQRELGTHEITDSLYTGLTRGVIQIIGCDKRGRVCLYVHTSRDFPDPKQREESTHAFDMILSFATRLRLSHRSCRVVMLINQKDASVRRNTDMILQASIALRVSKYYPGLIEHMYIVHMSRFLVAMAKPIFQRLPAVISMRIRILSDAELQNSLLLQWFDPNVLPKSLGGEMDRDSPAHWRAFADDVTGHFRQLQDAVLRRGMGVKEWELEAMRSKPTRDGETQREDFHKHHNKVSRQQQGRGHEGRNAGRPFDTPHNEMGEESALQETRIAETAQQMGCEPQQLLELRRTERLTREEVEEEETHCRQEGLRVAFGLVWRRQLTQRRYNELRRVVMRKKRFSSWDVCGEVVLPVLLFFASFFVFCMVYEWIAQKEQLISYFIHKEIHTPLAYLLLVLLTSTFSCSIRNHPGLSFHVVCKWATKSEKQSMSPKQYLFPI